MKKNMSTPEDRAYWKFVSDTAKKVRHWPKSMGGEGLEPVCCPTCDQPFVKKETKDQ